MKFVHVNISSRIELETHSHLFDLFFIHLFRFSSHLSAFLLLLHSFLLDIQIERYRFRSEMNLRWTLIFVCLSWAMIITSLVLIIIGNFIVNKSVKNVKAQI